MFFINYGVLHYSYVIRDLPGIVYLVFIIVVLRTSQIRKKYLYVLSSTIKNIFSRLFNSVGENLGELENLSSSQIVTTDALTFFNKFIFIVQSLINFKN